MQKKCKKCSRLLPEDYQYNECENCRGNQAEFTKKVIPMLFLGATFAAKKLLRLIFNSA